MDEPDGYSLPAQLGACKRKAKGLKAVVIEEFIERSESAKTSDRPELQRMLQYVKENRVRYVIVHKVDRLARNRVDDALINLALKQAGAELVSVSENIDQTPSGPLLHGIMSSIAEFYSRNLATEVIKGCVQKAKNGGTPGKAPVGYLNVRRIEGGLEGRTVEVDPERAPLVRWAFQAYATGDWTIRRLLVELTERGLTTVPGPKTPGRSLTVSHLHRMLRHPYYVGVVRYQGVLYEGKHEALVDHDTWQRVQELLSAKHLTGERHREHPHYLKGSIFCGQCGSRLIVCNAKGRGTARRPTKRHPAHSGASSTSPSSSGCSSTTNTPSRASWPSPSTPSWATIYGEPWQPRPARPYRTPSTRPSASGPLKAS